MNYSKPNKIIPRRPLQYLSPLHRAIRQIQDHLNAKSATMGISGTEGHLLSYLLSYSPVPVGDLVRVFGVKKSTLTGVLDRLEKSGFILRTLNPSDRRSFLLELTPKGQTIATKVRAQLDEFEASLEKQLSTQDKLAFNLLMKAISLVAQTPQKESTP